MPSPNTRVSVFTAVEGPGYAAHSSLNGVVASSYCCYWCAWRLELHMAPTDIRRYNHRGSCFKPSNRNNSKHVQLYKSSWHLQKRWSRTPESPSSIKLRPSANGHQCVRIWWTSRSHYQFLSYLLDQTICHQQTGTSVFMKFYSLEKLIHSNQRGA